MADTEQQVAMLGDTHHVSHAQCITENGEMITVEQTHVVDNGEVGEDILQQALDEATEGYDNTDVEYTTEENIAVVADGSGTLSDANGVTYSYVTAVPGESQTLATACQAQPGQSLIRIAQGTQVAGVGQVVAIQRPANNNIETATVTAQHQQEPQVVQVVRQQPNVVQQVVQPAQGVQTSVIEGIPTQGLPQIQQTHVQLSQTDSGTPGSITVLTNTGAGGEPLGSSGNPIRIIQQGNKYTSVQQLTPEQVAQIMQVVQQQQLAQTTTQSGGSSVLFNPQTQTRIVYRVIYPSELHSKTTGATGTIITGTPSKIVQPKTITVPKQMLTLGTPRRPYRKRLKDEDDKVDGPELTREEKEHRKKHRPRTRSGRVSRPPKHMVQDYKHIHHLDWEEDQDDSDGGYSDYKVSDDEASGKRESSRESVLIDTNINSSKPKKFKCDKCEKAYIGAAGLARHYRLNPDHGNAEDVLPTIGKTDLSTNGIDGNFADDSSTQDSISSTTSLPMTTPTLPIVVTPIPSTASRTEPTAVGDSSPETAPDRGTVPPPSTSNSSSSKTTLPRGALRAKQHYMQENTPTRRKGRLKELVRQCTDEELMEIVLPRLSRVITTWEFLLMKVERGRPSRPHITDVLGEYESLTKHVEKMCGDYLHPIAEGAENTERHSNTLQMTNPAIAQALGLNMGKYSVRDVPKRDESTFQYKLLTTDPGSMNAHHAHVSSNKRTVQLVTPDQLVTESPAKKARLNEPCITSVTQSSGVVTVSMANGVIAEGSTSVQLEVGPSQAEATSFPSQNQTGDETAPTNQDVELMDTASVQIDSERVDLEGANGNVENHVVLPATETDSGITITTDAVLVSETKDLKEEHGQTEAITSLVTGHEEVPTGSIETKESAFSHSMQVKGEDIGVSQTAIAVSDYDGASAVPNTVQVSVESADSNHLPPDQSTGERLEQVVEIQQEAVTEIVPQPTELEIGAEDSAVPPAGLPVDQPGELGGGGEPEAQVILSQQQQVVSQDGQTVLFTSDGGQTFYQQAPADIEHAQEGQQVAMEAGQQLVSMETPDGLVEGQLVTNEDGTQFIIPHQETAEQAVYQTPEGLIVIQNPDGTLRILSNGDPQIPLETVQALLAIDGEGGQIQVEGNMEQAT